MLTVVIGMYFVSKMQCLKTAVRVCWFFFCIYASSTFFCILYLPVSICALAIPICLDLIVFCIKLITISNVIMKINSNFFDSYYILYTYFM